MADIQIQEVAEIRPSAPELDYDIDKLAQCVAVAETSGCTKGMALTKRNCHGLMAFPKTGRTGRTFNSTEESFVAFKELWLRVYKVYPNLALAKKYTGNDNAQRWLNIVNSCYYK